MNQRAAGCCAFLLLAACRATGPGPALEIVLAGEADAAHVEARGLPGVAEPAEGWPALFSLSVASAQGSGGRATPTVLGRYELREGTLVFEPRFALEPGLEYTARLRPALLPGASGDEPDLRRSLVVPRTRPAPPAAVVAVYPTARPLPANLLKFYVHFSQPMARGFVYRHAHVLDPAGEAIESPFLELGEELWNPEATRLTLLIDPGRIKRGLLLHEQMGPVLEPDRSYTLLILAGWPSAAGSSLAFDLQVPFTTVGPDVTQPDPQFWKLEAPAAFTREPLVVAFDEPMDHALLQHMIQVLRIDGAALAGDVTLGPGETDWFFVPREAWTPQAHSLAVHPDLEDLAGNSVGRPFEVRLDAAPPARAGAPVGIPFQPRP